MKRKLIVLSIVLIFAGFIWFKYIKHGKYVANGVGGDIIDGSDYVESGEYYFNCDIGFFVKRIPPELDMDKIKRGDIKIVNWNPKDLVPILEKYMSNPDWEKGFKYVNSVPHGTTLRASPGMQFFHKYVKIGTVDYDFLIIQGGPFPGLRISLSQDSPESETGGGRTHAEAIEKAKNSCPDPQ